MYSGQFAKLSSADGVCDAAGASDAAGADPSGAVVAGAVLGMAVPVPLVLHAARNAPNPANAEPLSIVRRDIPRVNARSF